MTRSTRTTRSTRSRVDEIPGVPQSTHFVGWDANMTEIARMDELKQELEELRALVNTLLTIIMEEADGVQSGSAQPITPLPSVGYSM